MDNILIATVGGLIALVLWGASDWLTSRGSKRVPAAELNLILQIPGALIMIALWILSTEPIPPFKIFIMPLLAGICFSVAYLLYIKALSFGEAGVIVPLANTYPLVTLLLALLLAGVVFTLLQMTALLMIVLGAALLGTERLSWRRSSQKLSKEIILALMTAFFWGLGFFLINTVVDQLSWIVILGIDSIAMAIFAVIYFVYTRGRAPRKSLAKVFRNRVGLLAGITLTIGSVAFYTSSEVSGTVIIAATIAAASPLVTSILAATFDSEKVMIPKRIGAVCVVAGVVLLNLH